MFEHFVRVYFWCLSPQQSNSAAELRNTPEERKMIREPQALLERLLERGYSSSVLRSDQMCINKNTLVSGRYGLVAYG